MYKLLSHLSERKKNCSKSTLQIWSISEVLLPNSASSCSEPPGNVFRLYLSLILSPGLFLVQNFLQRYQIVHAMKTKQNVLIVYLFLRYCLSCTIYQSAYWNFTLRCQYLRGVVIWSSCQNMAHWMPGKTPHHSFMGLFHWSDLSIKAV